MNILTLVLFLLPAPLQEAREWEIQNLLNEIGPRIDRTFIYDSDLIKKMKNKRIQIPSLSRELSVTELTRILELALHEADLLMIPPEKSAEAWWITYENRSPRVSFPYLYAPDPIPEGHAYYCWVYVPKHLSAIHQIHLALINRATYPQGVLLFSPMILITDRASNIKTMEKILAQIDREKVTRVNLGKIKLPELASEPIDERLEKIALIKKKKEPRIDDDNPRQQDDDRPESKTRRIHSSASREVWLMDPNVMKRIMQNWKLELERNITVSPTSNGLRITKINSGLTGFSRGFKRDDVIRNVNGHTIKSLRDIEKLQNDPRNKRRNLIRIVIFRKGRNMVLEYRGAR